MELKLGLFTMPYQYLSLEKAFSDAKEFGYDFLELWGGQPHAYAPDLLGRGVGHIKDTCTSLNEYKDILAEIDSPRLCAMLDMVAPFSQGEDPANYGRVLKKRLKHLHLVDGNGVDETHLIPGEGCMDLKKILKELELVGFSGDATIELVTHYINDPSGAARLAIEKTRQLLG